MRGSAVSRSATRGCVQETKRAGACVGARPREKSVVGPGLYLLETAADPGAGDGAVADDGAGVRGLDHLTAADVDAHVVTKDGPPKNTRSPGMSALSDTGWLICC